MSKGKWRPRNLKTVLKFLVEGHCCCLHSKPSNDSCYFPQILSIELGNKFLFFSHCSAHIKYPLILSSHWVHRGFTGSCSRHKYQEMLENFISMGRSYLSNILSWSSQVIRPKTFYKYVHFPGSKDRVVPVNIIQWYFWLFNLHLLIFWKKIIVYVD